MSNETIAIIMLMVGVLLVETEWKKWVMIGFQLLILIITLLN